MRKKTIKIPLYYGDLVLIQTDDLEKVEKEYNTESLHSSEACVFRNHNKNGWSVYVMAFESKKPFMIAHESLHVVNRIFDDRGIKLDPENDEPQCFLLGWIVGECHKFLK